eukprot:9056823-Pyramimonas_sp.AAC.1
MGGGGRGRGRGGAIRPEEGYIDTSIDGQHLKRGREVNAPGKRSNSPPLQPCSWIAGLPPQ